MAPAVALQWPELGQPGHTGPMRIYLPATAADLATDALSPRRAHAATASLQSALPEEDEEGLEVSASLCAADASVLLLAEPEAKGLADRRIVIAADVDPEDLRELPVDEDTLPGTVEVTAEVPWDQVAAILMDEPAIEADVKLAREGDEEALERTADADLLWFDIVERPHLIAELS